MLGASTTTIFSAMIVLICVGLWLHARHKLSALQIKAEKISLDFSRAGREAQYYKIACENANDGVLVQDLNGNILWVNPAYCRIMGRAAHEMMGLNPLSFALPPEERPTPAQIADFRFDPTTMDKDALWLFRNVRGDGSLFWNQINASNNIAPDGTESIILVCRDVTQQIIQEKRLKETSEKLAHMAAHDDLRGVANRETITTFIDNNIAGHRQTDRHLGLFHIDLDRFKAINDTHGHAAGDAALKHVATTLMGVLRKTDMIARIGGDEFVVACPGFRDFNELQTIGTTLQESLIAPFQWQGCTIKCGISVGATLSNDTVKSGSELLQQSDFALYDVKRNGRGRVVAYDDNLHRRHNRERGLANDLRDALSSGTLDVSFRAALHLKHRHITGLDAHLSWDHPVLGHRGYNEIVDVARQTNLVADMDFATMDAALKLKSQLPTSPHEDIFIGFPASIECLTHPQFYQKLMASVTAHQIDPSSIVVQINEMALLDTNSRTRSCSDLITMLNETGFITMIDTFGMGRAGIGHLSKLDVRAIKIDPLLSAPLASEPTSQLILKTILRLCKDLNIYAIVDGIDTQSQLDLLQACGCKTIQGAMVGAINTDNEIFDFRDASLNGSVPFKRSAIAPAPNPRYLRANS